MVLAKENGLKNVFVSNGFESEHCVEACVGLLDAANIDLKSFSDGFYKSQCGARLQAGAGHLEAHATGRYMAGGDHPADPGGNDSDAELQELTGFIADRAVTHGTLACERIHPSLQISDRRPRPHPGEVIVGTGPEHRQPGPG
jgi:pyruvate formate lyase activating enzyme